MSEPLLDVAHGYTLISDDRLSVIWWAVKQTLGLVGDRIECGVYRGGSARLIAVAADPHPVGIYDNFGSGLPTPDLSIDRHSEGEFGGNTRDSIAAIMPANVFLHEGLLPFTLRSDRRTPIAFAHLDLDLYHSTLDTLKEIYSRIVRGGVIVMDDYGWPSTPGVTVAINEFFEDKSEVPLVAAKYQALVVKL